MPRKDRTGPIGMGAGTGRGMGPCFGRSAGGYGAGGRGLGWRRFWGYYPAPIANIKEEEALLFEEEKVLEEELKLVKERLAEIKK